MNFLYRPRIHICTHLCESKSFILENQSNVIEGKEDIDVILLDTLVACIGPRHTMMMDGRWSVSDFESALYVAQTRINNTVYPRTTVRSSSFSTTWIIFERYWGKMTSIHFFLEMIQLMCHLVAGWEYYKIS